MPQELSVLTMWTFVSECPIPRDIGPVLIDGEEPIAAYKTLRDSAVFTDRRLIVRDAQGMTGKKVEIYSLPYSSIIMWSSENAGMIDRGVDVRRLDSLISTRILTKAGH